MLTTYSSMGCISSRPSEEEDVIAAATYDDLSDRLHLPTPCSIFKKKHYEAAERCGYTRKQLDALRYARARHSGRQSGTAAGKKLNSSLEFAGGILADATKDVFQTFGRAAASPILYSPPKTTPNASECERYERQRVEWNRH
jgi:hypothetical protein